MSQEAMIVRETCLGDVAEDDFHVAECVNPDGSSSFWMLGFDGEPQGSTRIPDHELVGPLPWRIRERVEVIPTAGRCNAPTRTGRPCRLRAGGCPHHHADVVGGAGS